MSDFDVTIGLEVHLQLRTDSKMFCACKNRVGAQPNSLTCPVCLGMPGVLPVLNRKAMELGIRAALALNCRIAPYSKFDRKNYFYPDLPKGYQISQYYLPLSRDGYLEIGTTQGQKKVSITRLHLEEDAGKMVHGSQDDDRSYIDLNRVGVPLIEIVSGPDMSSAEEAYNYLKELKTLMEYLEVSDCNMQEGNLRCDANVSVSPKGSGERGVKTEVKNVNSLNYVRRAIVYEAERQWQVIRQGGRVTQDTVTWDEQEARTVLMRSKEYAHDYRYFPEPDLGSFHITEQWLAEIRTQLPELPQARLERLVAQYKINVMDAQTLVQSRRESDYFEECVRLCHDPQEIMNWIKGKVYTYLNDNKQDITRFPILPQNLVELIVLVKDGKVGRSAAKDIFDQMAVSGKPASLFAAEKEKVCDSTVLHEMCEQVLAKCSKLVADYRKNANAFNAIVGQVMRESKGRADTQEVRKILQEMLEKI
jgi:aspartyl-tRNA(Asn)/glutamyl-tRNA(Gln) amidotransferase subunit B